MPVFTFSGKSATGEKVSGERTAASKEALVAQLRRERIVPDPYDKRVKNSPCRRLAPARSVPRTLPCSSGSSQS
jgi:type II secretory pathway component PulF